MKGDMETEVLKDTTAQDDAARARKRMARIVQSQSEHETQCYDPNSPTQDKPAYYSE